MPDETQTQPEQRRWTVENQWCEECGWQTVADGPDIGDERIEVMPVAPRCAAMETTAILDALEKRAVEVIARTYDVRSGDTTERFWIQKGIEGMRFAIAEWIEKDA